MIFEFFGLRNWDSIFSIFFGIRFIFNFARRNRRSNFFMGLRPSNSSTSLEGSSLVLSFVASFWPPHLTPSIQTYHFLLLSVFGNGSGCVHGRHRTIVRGKVFIFMIIMGLELSLIHI